MLNNRVTVPALRFSRTAAVVLFFAARAFADTAPPQTEVWLISTRAAPRSAASRADDPRIQYWRMEKNAWSPADAGMFQAIGHPEVPATFVVHGNRAGPDEAIQVGCSVHRHLKGVQPDHPFRFAIWSWPSEQRCRGVRADVQLKAHYSDVQALYLAECLRNVSPDQPVTLVGYSFGERIVTGALELLAGGRVGGYRLGKPVVPRNAPWRAVLIAAALDAHWLLPGQRHGRALGQLDQMLVTVNPCDRVMRLYPRMYGRRGPEALGYFGMGCLPARSDRGKLEQLDVSCAVGTEHGWWSYWRSTSLRAAIASYSLQSP